MTPINVAVIGCGSFAQCFVPLFQAHPTVDKVFVCDLDNAKAENYKERFGTDIIPTFEEAIARPDVGAVAIFTERHTHAPLVLAALDAGKHVYSAVPMACTPEECKAIIDKAAQTGLTYMMGETCVYYPTAMYCKKEHEKGTFGDFVFGESQYFHDLSHFPKDYQESLASYSLPPFFYPTHSTAMILHATGAHATRVTAFGYKDKDPRYIPENNPWGNPFSGEFSLMELSCGGVARVSEVRRIGYKSPSSYISGFYGTQGSYQFSNAQHLVTRLTEAGVDLTDVSSEVNPIAMTENQGTGDFKHRVANHTWQWNSPAPIQSEDISRLPAAYDGAANGHMASHQFLIDDFCCAAATDTLPRVHAWLAARFTVPGLTAHASAKLGGVPLDIPDFGDAPDTW